MMRHMALSVLLGLIAAESPAQEPAVENILERASLYVRQYEATLGTVLADEDYRQVSIRNGVSKERTIASDFFLVFVPQDGTWRGLRDIRIVNGARLSRRERRIRALFDTEGRVKVERLLEEGARFNLGNLFYRTINVPTLPLRFLQPDLHGRFRFKLDGMEEREGTAASILRFKETKSPTVIQTRIGMDVFSSGRFWIDPDTGRIMATELIACDPETSAEGHINVRYEEDATLGLWVPTEMQETYSIGPILDPLNVIRCRAKYSRYRRYFGETNQTIYLPTER